MQWLAVYASSKPAVTDKAHIRTFLLYKQSTAVTNMLAHWHPQSHLAVLKNTERTWHPKPPSHPGDDTLRCRGRLRSSVHLITGPTSSSYPSGARGGTSQRLARLAAKHTSLRCSSCAARLRDGRGRLTGWCTCQHMQQSMNLPGCITHVRARHRCCPLGLQQRNHAMRTVQGVPCGFRQHLQLLHFGS